MENKKIAIFDEQEIRRHWDEDKEEWYFSVIDIIKALTDSIKPRDYWFKMKQRVSLEEGNELSTICRQLKLESSDGKRYLTDCANTESIFRIIQSIPSPKAEPFKLWLARVGYERIEEIENPEKGIIRSREYWKKMGRSNEWIQQRMMGQETRNKLTDYWSTHEVDEGKEYAILTDIIHKEWTGISTKEHKQIKSLKRENLRDHMNEAELLFTALAELSTRSIAEAEKAKGFDENVKPAKMGGRIAKNARKELEERTGKSVITDKNFLSKKTSKKLLTT
jgi:DNA-damage-inducible protein D